MPFYYGKRSAGICVFSARNSPCRLTISAAGTDMVRLIRHTVRPQRIPSGRIASWRAWGGGCNRLRLRFFRPAASHLPASPFPPNEGLLGQAPGYLTSEGRGLTLLGA
jgi:hypothetical protein